WPAAARGATQPGAHDRCLPARRREGAAGRHAHATQPGRGLHARLRAQLSRTGGTVRHRAAAVPARSDRARPQRLPGRQPAPDGRGPGEAARPRLAGAGAAVALNALSWRTPPRPAFVPSLVLVPAANGVPAALPPCLQPCPLQDGDAEVRTAPRPAYLASIASGTDSCT